MIDIIFLDIFRNFSQLTSLTFLILCRFLSTGRLCASILAFSYTFYFFLRSRLTFFRNVLTSSCSSPSPSPSQLFFRKWADDVTAERPSRQLSTDKRRTLSFYKTKIHSTENYSLTNSTFTLIFVDFRFIGYYFFCFIGAFLLPLSKRPLAHLRLLLPRLDHTRLLPYLQ